MSEHDDTLLDEDLGDEEYDLGNDEEEALLADDYELERQNSYKGEEETDDVLDLGVTDALDDLDAEDENIEFSRGNTDKRSDNDFYKDGDHPEAQSTSSYYEQDENADYANEHEALPQSSRNSESSSVNISNIGKGDLREKLQKNVQKSMYVGNGQGMEDDDCEEAKERRNRFQNERTMISPKMNNDIPDTLENVLTSEPSRMPFRGRGRGRGTRGSRGGRFILQNTGNFNPRFGTTRPSFENQPPACRPPLIQTRPCGSLLGVPSNIQTQQLIYQQANPQQSFQQPFGPNGPMQGPPPAQFVENRPQFNPGQFQGLLVPRPISSRLPEYGPRGPLTAGSMQGPNYNCPPNQPPYHSQPPMQPPFQNPAGIMQENRPMQENRLMQENRTMQGNQGPLLQGNPGGGSLLGNPNMLLPGNPPNMLPPGGNLPMPPMRGFPRQQPAQGPPMQNLPPNVQMPSQPPFENRLPPFQEPQFEGRSAYDARAGYHPDQVPNSQFNNTMPPLPQQSVSNVSHSVSSLPPGHKILINPHFRGTVQPANDSRLVWDSNQQVQPQASHSGQFPQPHPSYQNQGSYNQSSQQGPSQNYQQNYQQNKSDDPYAYFSDVWQENRPQRPQNMSPPSKHYPSDSNYSRESNYSDSKYKSEGQWDQKDNYQEDHRGSQQSYRERDLPLRTRNDHVQRTRTPPNLYRSDPYDQKTSRPPINVASRGVSRPPQKRISDSLDKGPREMSPKRSKPPNRNLQEVRRVDTVNETVADKEEDNDPEMQEYRKKMEEQKRLREKLLREKENRRKMAAIEKQNEDAKTDSSIAAANENTHQETKPVPSLMGFVNDSAVKTRPVVAKGRNRPVNTQSTEAVDRPSNVRIIRTIQTNDLSNMSGSKSNSGHATNQANDIIQTRQVVQQSGVRRVVIQKPLLNSQKIATTIQKTVSNLQKSQGLQQKISNTQVIQTQKVLQNQGNMLQKSAVVGSKAAVVNQRIVAHKTPGGLQKTVINDSANVHGQKVTNAQQNPQRIVLQKSAVQAKKLPEIKTNTVKLENLAASTSETQIRRMCQAIGTIESIRMGEGSATIVFKTQSAAMVFHKKYQRKMLDLSLITVRLVPQSASGNKAVMAVTKKS